MHRSGRGSPVVVRQLSESKDCRSSTVLYPLGGRTLTASTAWLSRAFRGDIMGSS